LKETVTGNRRNHRDAEGRIEGQHIVGRHIGERNRLLIYSYTRFNLSSDDLRPRCQPVYPFQILPGFGRPGNDGNLVEADSTAFDVNHAPGQINQEIRLGASSQFEFFFKDASRFFQLGGVV
jgi:hypothetical protein